jgi:hypothetical protein
MIVLAISLLFTLIDRWQLLQARAPACVRRVRVSANALTARCALLQRGLRMCGPQCVRHWGKAKGTARVAMRCVATARDAMRCNALQAFADLFSGSAQPWSQGGSTFMLVGAPSNRPQHARTRSYEDILLALACAQSPAHTHKHTHTHTCVCSACAVVHDKRLVDVRGLHDVHGVHRPPSVFEAARSDPSHKAHRPPALRGPLLGMRTVHRARGLRILCTVSTRRTL